MSVEIGPRRGPQGRLRLGSLMQTTTVGGRPLSWYVGGWRLGVLVLAVMVVFPWTVGPQYVADAITVGIYVIAAIGLNMVVGYAGLLDLGYVAFFALGAYTVGTLTYGSIQVNATTGQTVPLPVLPFWPILIIGALVAGVFGVLLGAPTLRLRGDYLAIVTLGFGEIIPIIFNYAPFWLGNTGITANSPADINLGSTTITFSDPLNRAPYYYIVLAVAALVVLASASLRDSSLGRAWVAIREDETAAASSGVNLVVTKLLAFGLGATIGGLAGVLQGAYVNSIAPVDFSFYFSISILIMIVLGGIGSIPGVILGAVILRSLDVFILSQVTQAIHASGLVAPAGAPLHFLAAIDFNQLKYLLYGLVLLAMILFRPQGLIPDVRRRRELVGIGAAVEGTSAVGLLEREEAGIEVTALDALDETRYEGPGADDINRGDG
jgi:branched-chain amino acid transport system permease protein